MSLVLIVGAGGIVGQHLRLYQPLGVSAVYTARQKEFPRDYPLKLTSVGDVDILLERWAPSVVINLAGENRPDVVERDPVASAFINVQAPIRMAAWCREWGRSLIHVSTQGVLGGTQPPYHPESDLEKPVNAYGRQKLEAEAGVLQHGGLVARLTFILGIRPFPLIGRANPLEQILSATGGQRQVSDRTFSPCFARDAAEELWVLATQPVGPRVVHIGLPIPKTRADIAEDVLARAGQPVLVERVLHDESFPTPQWAPRPLDTTFTSPARHRRSWDDGLTEALETWRTRLDYMDQGDRAVEIGMCLGLPVAEVAERLSKGFGYQHGQVAVDFRRINPQTDDELLAWYRGTDAYIWELTAYHLDAGFNYMGMCQGIVEHLKANGKTRVLCVGDGVGDLTMKCKDAGLQPIYHDLAGSKTAAFAQFRMARRYGPTGGPWIALSSYWEAPDDGPAEHPEFALTGTLDAVVALDFFEHMTDVEAWVRRAWDMLKPGGLFLGQNAFGIGNEPGGSLPMHLVRNNRFEKDWDPLMDGIGYVRTGEGNWRRKPA